MTNKFQRTEQLCLKKSSRFEKIIEQVPKPDGAIPKFGLPKWKTMPLGSKLPLIPGPKDANYFSRKKVGKKLRIQIVDSNFDISDPYNYDIKLEFDELHDEHLTNFYKSPANIQRMINLGFVTKNLDAKCSLKDYNTYRAYLRKVHSKSVRKTLKNQAEMRTEKNIIELSEENARKYLERLRKNEKVQSLKKAEEKINSMKQKEFKNRILRYNEQLIELKQKRKDDSYKRKCKQNARMQRFKKMHEMCKKLEREKLAEKIKNRKKDDKRRIQLRKRRLNEKKEKRNKFIADRWERKRELQIQQIEKEKFLKQTEDEASQKFIKEYNKKIEKARTRVQKLLENRKRRKRRKRPIFCKVLKRKNKKVRQ